MRLRPWCSNGFFLHELGMHYGLESACHSESPKRSRPTFSTPASPPLSEVSIRKRMFFFMPWRWTSLYISPGYRSPGRRRPRIKPQAAEPCVVLGLQRLHLKLYERGILPDDRHHLCKIVYAIVLIARLIQEESSRTPFRASSCIPRRSPRG